MFRRNSLPKPQGYEMSALNVGPDLNSILNRLAQVNVERIELANRLAGLNLESEMLALTVCGSTNESQDVEFYDGTLGVSQALVAKCAPSIGMLQWRSNLNQMVSHPGNVSGQGWATGGLITEDLFLTASHPFDKETSTGYVLPSRNGTPLNPQELAVLMQVAFNYQYQKNVEPKELRQIETFPVTALVEYHDPGIRVDYAIVRLGRNNSGLLPGDRFGSLPVAQENVTVPETMLCLIQHSGGNPKMIEAGPMQINTGSQIRYQSIDTLNTSSGAPLISEAGEIVGVHNYGGCTQDPGSFNFGAPIKLIRAASTIL